MLIKQLETTPSLPDLCPRSRCCGLGESGQCDCGPFSAGLCVQQGSRTHVLRHYSGWVGLVEKKGHTFKKALQAWAEAWPAGQRCKGLPSGRERSDTKASTEARVGFAIAPSPATFLSLAHRQRASMRARVSSGVDSSTGCSRNTRLGSSFEPAPCRAGSAMSPLSATSLTT